MVEAAERLIPSDLNALDRTDGPPRGELVNSRLRRRVNPIGSEGRVRSRTVAQNNVRNHPVFRPASDNGAEHCSPCAIGPAVPGSM